MPESAYSAGLSYRSKHYWSMYLNANFFDHMYIPFNPARRTLAAVDQIDGTGDLRAPILSQEETASQFTLDFSFSWSWKVNNKIRSIEKNTFLLFNLGVNNILDNKDIVSGGYEQLRYDFTEKNPGKFATKYYYSPGINFFASVALRIE